MRIWSNLLRVNGKLKTCLSEDCPNVWSEVETAWALRRCFKCERGIGERVLTGQESLGGGLGSLLSQVPKKGPWGTRRGADAVM